jgi:hypothetical protein
MMPAGGKNSNGRQHFSSTIFFRIISGVTGSSRVLVMVAASALLAGCTPAVAGDQGNNLNWLGFYRHDELDNSMPSDSEPVSRPQPRAHGSSRAEPDVSAAVSQLIIWDACVTGSAERYARTSESAETIADAAMTFCQEQRWEYQRRMRDIFNRLPLADPLRAGNDAYLDAENRARQLRRKAVVTVLEARTR